MNYQMHTLAKRFYRKLPARKRSFENKYWRSGFCATSGFVDMFLLISKKDIIQSQR